MSKTSESATNGTAAVHDPEQRSRLTNGICCVGAGFLALGLCLHAIAAACALTLAISMAVLGITGGSVAWAIAVGAVLVAATCAMVVVCRRRTRRSRLAP